MSPIAPKPDHTIHVVDDDEALRDSVCWLLESSGYGVRSYASAEAFLKTYDENPDGLDGCLLLDVRMPGMSGLELFEELTRRHCILPVIFITGHGDVPMAVAALKKGAADFIEKPFNNRELIELIAACLERAEAQRSRLRQGAEMARRLEQLTQREQEVLDLIIAGKLNKQIADMLGISIKTVEVHRARVMEKMGASSLAELVQAVLSSRASLG